MKKNKKIRIVHLAFGKGSGHLMKANSIFNAMKRQKLDIDYILLTDSEFTSLAEKGLEIYPVNLQPKILYLSPQESDVYLFLMELCPDVLVIDGLWFPFLPIIKKLDVFKMILFRYYSEEWFTIPFKNKGAVRFDAGMYDLAFSIEPYFSRPGLIEINPLIIKNHDEILSQTEARKKLNAGNNEKVVVLAHNGFEGELDRMIKSEKNLMENTKVIIASTHSDSGLHPLANYANGIDLLIGGAGYNLFYETRYFNISTRLYPQERHSNEQFWRMEHCCEFEFKENGADQLVDRFRKKIGI